MRNEVFNRVPTRILMVEDTPTLSLLYKTILTRAGHTVHAANDAGERLGDGALYAFVGPNLMMNRYGPILDINVVFPTGAETCTVVFDFFFTPDSSKDTQFVADSLAKSEQVQQEDMMICGSVQRGLRSSAYETGRYAPRLEHGMYAFHQWLAHEMSAALPVVGP